MDFDGTRYERLISGTDLRGVALDGYGSEVTLTAQDAAAAAYAFAAMLAKNEGAERPRVAIGTDPRLSGEALRSGVEHGLAAAGCEVIDCGLSTTPAMFSATMEPLGAHGSIMITASHLPLERNGLKFFTRQGGLTGAQLRELVAAMRPVRAERVSEKSLLYGLLREYAEGLVRFIDPDGNQPLEGMIIVLDAGNGSGGFFKDVLERAGATVHGLFLKPDGSFPNHPPNPEDASALEALIQGVKRWKADLGIIFDADCDRVALVDRQGRPVNRDRLIALVAALLLSEYPGSTIVTDSVTSTGVARFISDRGGVHRRFKRGYRNVIEEAIRLNAEGVDCPCAIETSGHCALRENRFLDDGAYLIAWLLGHFGKILSQGCDWTELIADLKEPEEDVEIRLPLPRGNFAADAERILGHVQETALRDNNLALAPDNVEGVRVYCPEGGWFMVRRSVHDPVLPVNIQADNEGGARVMAAKLYAILEPFIADGLIGGENLESFIEDRTK